MDSDWINELMDEFAFEAVDMSMDDMDRYIREMLLAAYERGYDEAMAATVTFGVRDE